MGENHACSGSFVDEDQTEEIFTCNGGDQNGITCLSENSGNDCPPLIQEECDANLPDLACCNMRFDDYKYNLCPVKHTYVTSGQKVIKAIIFRTVNIDEDIEKDSNDIDLQGDDGGLYVQAIDWQLATIKINLSDKGFLLEADFGDLGGDDFTYLPYPDIKPLRNQIVDASGNIDFLQTPSDRFYNSSHIVVSGLHESSKYVNSLTKIKNSDPFDESEGTKKSLLNRSYNLSPAGTLDEIGQFLGKSNIGQVRLFNQPFDIREFLNISYIDTVDGLFHSHTDKNYWNGYGEEYRFPEESPLGDIFISEYEYFRQACLVELNMENLNQKTVRDSSGNANAGILIGDFSVKKEEPGELATRDSYIVGVHFNAN